MKVSLSQIKAAYSEEKKRWDFTYPWLYFVIRPVSFWMTWLLMPLGISANQVTFISVLVGLVSFAFFAQGYGTGFYAGTILLVLFNLLDCVDGNIARFRKTDGPVGNFFDGLAVIHPLSYAFIGFGLYLTPDRSLELIIPGLDLAEVAGISLFCAGVATTFAKLFSNLVQTSFFSIFGHDWDAYRRRNADKYVSHAEKWYMYVYRNITELQAHEFILLAAVAAKLVGLFVIVSALISLSDLVFNIFMYVRRAGKMTKQ